MQKKGGEYATNDPKCTNAERKRAASSTTSARDHTRSTPIFISFSQNIPNITSQHQHQRTQYHQNQHVTQHQHRDAQHSTAEQRTEQNGMHPSTPNGRVARARGGKCARMPLERAFACWVDNYSRTTLNRGSTPRGTLRNTDSHKVWEQVLRFVADCGRFVPWLVPGDMVRPRFFRCKSG